MKLILSKWSSFIFNNIFALFGGRIFQDSRYTFGCKLYSSSRRLIPLFIFGRRHIGASQE
jgi:hypothetical protein